MALTTEEFMDKWFLYNGNYEQNEARMKQMKADLEEMMAQAGKNAVINAKIDARAEGMR